MEYFIEWYSVCVFGISFWCDARGTPGVAGGHGRAWSHSKKDSIGRTLVAYHDEKCEGFCADVRGLPVDFRPRFRSDQSVSFPLALFPPKSRLRCFFRKAMESMRRKSTSRSSSGSSSSPSCWGGVVTGESNKNRSSGRSCSSIFGCLRWNRFKR